MGDELADVYVAGRRQECRLPTELLGVSQDAAGEGEQQVLFSRGGQL